MAVLERSHPALLARLLPLDLGDAGRQAGALQASPWLAPALSEVGARTFDVLRPSHLLAVSAP